MYYLLFIYIVYRHQKYFPFACIFDLISRIRHCEVNSAVLFCCILVAKGYILQQKCPKKWLGNCPRETRWYNFQPPKPTLSTTMRSITDGHMDKQIDRAHYDAKSRSHWVQYSWLKTVIYTNINNNTQWLTRRKQHNSQKDDITHHHIP